MNQGSDPITFDPTADYEGIIPSFFGLPTPPVAPGASISSIVEGAMLGRLDDTTNHALMTTLRSPNVQWDPTYIGQGPFPEPSSFYSTGDTSLNLTSEVTQYINIAQYEPPSRVINDTPKEWVNSLQQIQYYFNRVRKMQYCFAGSGMTDIMRDMVVRTMFTPRALGFDRWLTDWRASWCGHQRDLRFGCRSRLFDAKSRWTTSRGLERREIASSPVFRLRQFADRGLEGEERPVHGDRCHRSASICFLLSICGGAQRVGVGAQGRGRLVRDDPRHLTRAASARYVGIGQHSKVRESRLPVVRHLFGFVYLLQYGNLADRLPFFQPSHSWLPLDSFTYTVASLVMRGDSGVED
jgi:hypothetical protein